ncbi:MFS transporter [Cellulomonas soli]|uniref:MFS transporter n=1 Tax=Cellulomonas soli TaxID=931535 RepID=A0A512PB52_9CELL|nr:MFS transporter [Cellulomonas soli]NYI57378.1 UMF1 family MFS transporter [Cellulomonas soli]GEP68342.1 MFS transporter [Cellulomonas soli]
MTLPTAAAEPSPAAVTADPPEATASAAAPTPASIRSDATTEVHRRPGQIAAWAAWDWGSAAFNAVITTFVFTRWLTSDAFVDPALVSAAGIEGADGGPATDAVAAVLATHSAWLGWGLTAAGALIALVAPVVGARADAAGRHLRRLGRLTAVTVLLCAAMFLVRPAPDALAANVLLGLTLLALANVAFELASVHYNALLPTIASGRTLGRVSGLGWGAGYLGGIVLLLVLFVGFINPDVGWFGVTGEGGLDVRVSVLVAAGWFALFATPVRLALPDSPASTTARPGVVASYRTLARDVAGLWRGSRSTLLFLLASAVYRDGLAGVFTFGAVIASGTFGFDASQVVLFAIAANVVAGLSTVLAGFLDDRVGPKAVIVASLVGLLVTGLALFALHDAGQGAFWVGGLALCAFVGPAQSSSRSQLARLAPAGRTSELFGLYATTGRAASFMAPLAFSVAVTVSGSQHWGILGIMVVLLAGLVALLPLRLSGPVARP